jgi:glycosyltransferase involved in cell wall biosynthesis
VTDSPRAVFGVPLYNNERHLPEALESLLRQTYDDVAFVLVDDGSTDGTEAIAERYAALDRRISYERNANRLGMVRNWRKTFDRASELFPDFEYFAWGSDHDVWHPRWLATLIRELDEDPEAVAAYPHTLGIDDGGTVVRQPWSFSTTGVPSPRDRLRLAVHGMTAGSMVYALFRREPLARCGVYREMLLPDRLLLAELALHGTFAQAPPRLWYRRYRTGTRPSYARQRATFFVDRSPAMHTLLPWVVQHTGALVWNLVVLGRGPEKLGRLRGAAAAFAYAVTSLRYDLARRVRRLEKRGARLFRLTVKRLRSAARRARAARVPVEEASKASR